MIKRSSLGQQLGSFKDLLKGFGHQTSLQSEDCQILEFRDCTVITCSGLTGGTLPMTANSDLQLCKVKQEELSCCDQAGHLMISPVWSLLRKTGHTLSLREFYGQLNISNPCFLQLPALPSFFPYSSETLYMNASLTTVTQSLDKQMCVECQMHNSRSASLSNLYFHLN
jgi:hypothetical protein